MALVSLREYARLHSLWHICLSFYTQMRFVSEQYWTRKCHPCKNHPGCCQKPQTVGVQFISIQCAAATENVTCCHHIFKIWRSDPEFSQTVNFVKGIGFKIWWGYLLTFHDRVSYQNPNLSSEATFLRLYLLTHRWVCHNIFMLCSQTLCKPTELDLKFLRIYLVVS